MRPVPCKYGHTSGRYAYGACKKCARLRYQNNLVYRERQIKRARARREANRSKWNACCRDYRTKKKEELIAYKGGKCADCNGIFPVVCYDFDHREPNDKSFAIGQKIGMPMEELKREADKCDLVCRNCHAIRTSQNSKVAAKISRGLRRRRSL